MTAGACGRAHRVRSPDRRASLDEALERGEVSLVAYRVPPGASSELSPAGLPQPFIAVARARADSIEVTNAEQRWRAGDEVIVLSLLSDVETLALLEEIAIGRRSARAAAAAQLPDAPPAGA